MLKADPEALDLLRFEDVAERARRLGLVELYDEALDCWRGTVLADLPGSIRQHPVAVAVTARRVTTAMAYADLVGETGGHSRAADRLAQLADEQPLHDAVQARLMLALAGSGQQAAALRLFDDVRRQLDDELGVEPGQELRDAHLRVLCGDSGSRRENTVRPAQLPADVAGFVGRDADLRRLDEMRAAEERRGALPVLCIAGTPGVGKTALAVRWAHRTARSYPDGQLYVNLRGYDPASPMQPIDALARFLRALGVPSGQVPVDEDEAATLYRTLLNDRRILVVLDNASSADQVRSLLPGSQSCAVLVASRSVLAGLSQHHGSRRLNLDALTPEAATRLLESLVGRDRARAEPGADADLAAWCGYLPLALRVVGADLDAQPYASIADRVVELRERGRMIGPRDDTVRAAFDLSYERLDADQQRQFRLLGLVPGPDFGIDAAAALTGRSTVETRGLLGQLAGASLIQEHTPGRYRFHDLLRAYAASRAADDTDRPAAVCRLYDFYLHSASSAGRELYPNTPRLPLPEVADPHTGAMADGDAALAWLDAERTNLLEAVTRADILGVPDYAWRLVDALHGYLDGGGYNAEAQRACSTAIAVSRDQGNRHAEASVLSLMGLLQFNISAFDQALVAHRRELALCKEAGDRVGEATALYYLGRVYSALSYPMEVLTHCGEAMRIMREQGNELGEARAAYFLAASYNAQGILDKAEEYGQRVLDLCRRVRDLDLEARAVYSIATVMSNRGDLTAARTGYANAATIAKNGGNRHLELSATVCLAEVCADADDLAAAQDQAGRGLSLARKLGERRQLSGCLEVMGIVSYKQARLGDAERYLTEAVQLADSIKFMYGRISSMIALSKVYRATDRLSDAAVCVRGALDRMAETHNLKLQPRALTELAHVLLAEQQYDDARSSGNRALTFARERAQMLAAGRALVAPGDICEQTGDEAGARDHWQTAMTTLRGRSETDMRAVRRRLEGVS